MSKSRGVWIFLAFVTRVFAWSCDFENGDYCDLKQSSDDDFDWTLGQGGTPSNLTGPSTDHTRVDSSGYYLFIETSDPRVTNDNAVLVSPEFPAGFYSVSFWYHAYGTQIGVFRANLRHSVSHFYDLIFYHSSRFTQSNNQWVQASMNFSTSNSFNIIFEGIRGFGPHGDIGLDDIVLQKIREPLPEDPPSPVGLPILCTFETDADCGLESPYYTSQINWSRNRGPTPSDSTGPEVDHTIGTAKGYYIFAEASYTSPNWTCIIATRYFWPTDGCFTLSFYYHAYGVDVNALQVFEEGVLEPIWKISPTSSVYWRLVKLTHTLMKPGKLLFVSITGFSYKADYGLDDITIRECENSTKGEVTSERETNPGSGSSQTPTFSLRTSTVTSTKTTHCAGDCGLIETTQTVENSKRQEMWTNEDSKSKQTVALGNSRSASPAKTISRARKTPVTVNNDTHPTSTDRLNTTERTSERTMERTMEWSMEDYRATEDGDIKVGDQIFGNVNNKGTSGIFNQCLSIVLILTSCSHLFM